MADAGAGDRPCGLRPQQLLQGQLPVPHVDRRRRRSSTTWSMRRTTSPSARSATACDAVEDVLDCCHALHELRRRPLSPAAARSRWSRRRRGARTARPTLQQQVNDMWRTLPKRSRASGRRRSSRALSRGAAGEHALLHREERAAARALAARDRAHRAQDRAVFLSAAPDPGHERGLGDVLALHAAQHAVRRGAADRRLDDRVAEVAHQRGLPAAGRRTRPTAASIPMRWASRCTPTCGASARSRPTRTASGSPRSPARRLAADAGLRDAQLQGRELHRPVPVAEADARVAPVRDRRRRARRANCEVSAIHDDSGYRRVREALSRQYDLELRASPTSRSGTSTCAATVR